MMKQDLCDEEGDTSSRLQEEAHGRGHQQEDGQDLGGEGQAEQQAMLLEALSPGQQESINEGNR